LIINIQGMEACIQQGIIVNNFHHRILTFSQFLREKAIIVSLYHAFLYIFWLWNLFAAWISTRA